MQTKFLSIASAIFLASCGTVSTEKTTETQTTNQKEMKEHQGECPMGFGKQTKSTGIVTKNEGKTNHDWWPNQLDLTVLRKNAQLSNPLGEEFSYKNQFNQLDYTALKKDLTDLMTDSQDWWPADFGHYGGLFIRLAWHSAGTYRTGDGRGGTREGKQRFAPQNSWPDNANLDKARRLLWPIKQKYGQKISWGDLFILAGNVALESTGFKTVGFAGGRTDTWEPQTNVYWGAEKEWLANDTRWTDKDLEKPLAAVQMGLIYVNPEGPNGNPDPLASAQDIRISFARMGMNDEETVALIAGGHTLGKTHGAASGDHMGAAPEGADIEEMGLGWKSDYKSGKGADAITSGLEVTWTKTPTQWSQGYFKSLFENEWELVKSPAGAWQFEAKTSDDNYPDAFDSKKAVKPGMLVSDIALIKDSSYLAISKRFYENPKAFDEAFAQAWFKLTHRDMGPKSTYLGIEAPKETYIWQDPIPVANYDIITAADEKALKSKIEASGLSTQALLNVAWAAASTYRDSDRRGGVNGARIRLEPQVNWESNNPTELKKVLAVYEGIKQGFDGNNKKVSIADLIVLGGNLAVEMAAKKAGYAVSVPFTAGRTDASQEQTSIENMDLLKPMADGFRNYQTTEYTLTSEQLLIDKAQLLKLSAPELTVLLGGLRAMGVTYNNSQLGILTSTPGLLNNNYFKNLLSMDFEWKPQDENNYVFEGFKRGTSEKLWTATRADLIFGSNSELRAISEVYASADAGEKLVNDFVAAWTKVMMLDRFDIK